MKTIPQCCLCLCVPSFSKLMFRYIVLMCEDTTDIMFCPTKALTMIGGSLELLMCFKDGFLVTFLDGGGELSQHTLAHVQKYHAELHAEVGIPSYTEVAKRATRVKFSSLLDILLK